MALFSVDKLGNVHLGYLFGQLGDIGLPEAIAVDFVRQSGEAIGKRLPRPKGGAWWTKLGTLQELKANYEGFAQAVRVCADSINAVKLGRESG